MIYAVLLLWAVASGGASVAAGCAPSESSEPGLLRAFPSEVRFVHQDEAIVRIEGSWQRHWIEGDADFVATSTHAEQIRVRWQPQAGTSGFRQSELHVESDHDRVVVPLSASTYRNARVEWGVDRLHLGSVASGPTLALRVPLRNIGRTTARLGRPRFSGSGVSPRDETDRFIPPLQTAQISVPVRWAAGPVASRLTWTGPDAPAGGIEVFAQGFAPVLTVEPRQLDFGAVLLRTEASAVLDLVPVGGLPVHLTHVAPPSSRAFRVDVGPGLIGQTHRVRVRFRPDDPGTVKDRLLLSYDGASGSVTKRVELRGVGLSCEAQCRAPHAEVACRPECVLVGCSTGWVDANRDADDGCECRDSGDVGATCGRLEDLGRLHDDGSSLERSGTIAGDEDQDLYRLHATDGFHLFREDFDLIVEVTEGELCVARAAGRVDVGVCLLEDWVCPEDGRYRLRGRFGSEDEATLWIRVRGTGCRSYTLRARNGD